MDEKDVMEIYKNLSAPGEPHKLLGMLEGSWIAKSRSWEEPDKKVTESSGTCERKLILGGRYLQEEFSGEMAGSPFKGIGFTGYDNLTRNYIMVWMDSLSTGIYVFRGNASADGKSLEMEGRFEDPVKGRVRWRSVTRIIDKDSHVFEVTAEGARGKKERMVITYVRKPVEEEVLLTRIFNAPREVLFKEWTDPEYLKRWWGPRGFTLPVFSSELWPGGVTHYCMRSPDGRDYCGRGEYQEVVAPERIIYTDSFADAEGHPVSAALYGLNPDWPSQTRVIVTFDDVGDRRTRVTLRHLLGNTVPAKEKEMCREGWGESLDKLAEELQNSCAELGVC